ncbi:hypothetical protein ACJX0J_013043 [Zea mays]
MELIFIYIGKIGMTTRNVYIFLMSWMLLFFLIPRMYILLLLFLYTRGNGITNQSGNKFTHLFKNKGTTNMQREIAPSVSLTKNFERIIPHTRPTTRASRLILLLQQQNILHHETHSFLFTASSIKCRSSMIF